MSNGNAFAITTEMSGGVELQPGQKRRVVFSVQNISGRALEGRARVQVDLPGQQAWYAIDGRTENRFDIDEVHQYSVDVEIPADAQDGRYAFELECAWVDRPEELYGRSSRILVVVKKEIKENGGGIPMWVWFVVGGVVLLVGGGLAWLFLSSDGVEVPQLEGLQVDSAIVVLDSLELASSTTPRPTIGQDGIVLEQVPDSGEVVSSGDTVELIVSERAAVMPGLIGQPMTSAISRLNNLGFPVTVKRTTRGALNSTVYAQFPAQGDTVTVGDSISVTFTIPSTFNWRDALIRFPEMAGQWRFLENASQPNLPPGLLEGVAPEVVSP